MKVGLDDFLLANGEEAFEALVHDSLPLIDWAVDGLKSESPSSKEAMLRWLLTRFKSFGETNYEFLISQYRVRIGISVGALRGIGQSVDSWMPRAPRVEREAQSEEQEKKRAAERAASDEGEARNAYIEKKALELLSNPALMYRVSAAMYAVGLVGETANGLICFLALTSRILMHPTSLTVKGESSAGKSYLIETILRLFPSEAYIALTGMSRQALVYMEESFSHKAVVIFERSGMEAADYNIRSPESEGKIVFETVEKDPSTNRQRTVIVEKEGPTNFISTTTAPQLHAENETRHWSLFIDESEEQTEAIKAKQA